MRGRKDTNWSSFVYNEISQTEAADQAERLKAAIEAQKIKLQDLYFAGEAETVMQARQRLGRLEKLLKALRQQN